MPRAGAMPAAFRRRIDPSAYSPPQTVLTVSALHADTQRALLVAHPSQSIRAFGAEFRVAIAHYVFHLKIKRSNLPST